MLQAVSDNQFDTVVVWRLDRLSRKPSVGFKLRDAMDATLTGFHSIVEGSTVNNAFAFGLWLLIAEQESDIKSERARIGGIGRARRGLITNKAKYGYRKGEDGKPQIHEPEVRVVKRIFQQYVEDVPTPRPGVKVPAVAVWATTIVLEALGLCGVCGAVAGGAT